MNNPPIPSLQTDTAQPSGQPWQPQSPDITALKVQLERVQLPPIKRYRNPNRVVVQSSKVVRGWGDDPGLRQNS